MEVSAYLVIYQHNPGFYSYRLYNKRTLAEITTNSTKAQENIMTSLSLFAFFEKNIHDRDSTEIETAFKGTVYVHPLQWLFEAIENDFVCFSEIQMVVTYNEGGLPVEVNPWIHIHCEPIGSGGTENPNGIPEGGGGYFGDDPSTNNFPNEWWEGGWGAPVGTAGLNSSGVPTYSNDYEDPDHPSYDPSGPYSEFYPWWNPLQELTNGDIDNKSEEEANDPDNNSLFGYDETTYSSYNHLIDPWPHVSPIIPKSQFVPYGSLSPPNDECFDYCKEQIRLAGYKLSNYYTNQTIQIYTESGGVNSSNFDDGISYLVYAITNSIPVVVGVDKESGSPNVNTDNTTDHFIVIVGMGSDAGGNYFTFYDNSTSSVARGASSLNRLYVDYTNHTITGKSMTPYAQGSTYQVTQIRKSKPL